MPYTPLDGQIWEDKPSTLSPINAARLNHMEEGIGAATTLAEGASTDAADAGAAALAAGADADAALAAANAKLAAVPPGSGERGFVEIMSGAVQPVAAGATVVLNVNASNQSQVAYVAGNTPAWATTDLVNNRVALNNAGLYRVTWRMTLGAGTAGNLFFHWLRDFENIGAFDGQSQPSNLPRLAAVRGTGGTFGGDHVVWVDAPDTVIVPSRLRRVFGPSVNNVGAAAFNVTDVRLIIELLTPTAGLPTLALPAGGGEL